MENIIISFLRKEKVTSILCTHKVTYRELTGVDIYYVKDGKYYVATSFYTDAWMAREPIGPVANWDGKVWAESIYDVATIAVYNDVVDWKAHADVTKEYLQRFYEYVNGCARVSADRLLSQYKNLIYKTDFLLLPSPMILVVLARGDQYLGTISISMDGYSRAVATANDVITDVLEFLSYNANHQIYKEFMYVE